MEKNIEEKRGIKKTPAWAAPWLWWPAIGTKHRHERRDVIPVYLACEPHNGQSKCPTGPGGPRGE